MRLIASNNELHKIQRLERLLKIVTSMLGVSYTQICKLVESIENDRAVLIVRWHDGPTDQQIAAFATAWEICGEHRNQIRHVEVVA